MDPGGDLCCIRTLEQRLGRSLHNGQKGRNRFHATIAWRIVIFVQITIIPRDLRIDLQKGLSIQTLTRAAPTGAKTDHDQRLMRNVWILFDQTLEKLLAREGRHFVRVRHRVYGGDFEEK